jgi:tRNA(fMet)-specific endonuclease VapC
MDRAILDTDILSELLKGRDQRVTSRAATYRSEFGRFTLSAFTVVEIVKGLAKAGREERIAIFLEFVQGNDVLTLDVEGAMIGGRIYAGLEARGMPIGRIDPLIAAIALRNDLTLVTGNTDHYERIRDLGFSLALTDWRNA